MKKKILAVVVVAILGATAWTFMHRKKFLYAGTIEATDVDLSPQLTAVISTVTVHEGDPVTKGQTASSSYKNAILENGMRVLVPPFIEKGTRIVVATDDGSYVKRAE